MGRFNKTYNEKEITLGDEKLLLKPLGGKHLGLFAKMGEDKGAALNGMITATLKEADPTITDADIDELSLGDLSKLMEVIVEINNLG